MGASGMSATSAKRRVMHRDDERPPVSTGTSCFDPLELLDEKVPLGIAGDTASNHALQFAAVGKKADNLGKRSIQSEIHARLEHQRAVRSIKQIPQRGVVRRWSRTEICLKCADRIGILLRIAVVVSRDRHDLP